MTEVQKQQERLTALKAQRRELEAKLETAAGAEQAQLQLELAVCIEDMLSAAVVAKKAGAESKAKPSTPETPYDAWVSQSSGDNSVEHRRLKEALDRVCTDGPRTARQREFWELYNLEHKNITAIARIYGVSASSVSRTIGRANANIRRLAGQYNTVVENIERGALFPAEGVASTERQLQMLRMYRDGANMPQIAETLGVSASSVSRTIGRARAEEAKLLSLAADNGEGPTGDVILDLTDLRTLEFLTGILSARMQMIMYLRLCEALTYDKITELIGLSRGDVEAAEAWAQKRIAASLKATKIKLKNPDVLPELINDAYTRMEREPVEDVPPPRERLMKPRDPTRALSREPENAVTPEAEEPPAITERPAIVTNGLEAVTEALDAVTKGPEPVTETPTAETKKPAPKSKRGKPKVRPPEHFTVGVEYSDGRSIDAGAIDRYAGTELSPFMRRMVSAAKQRTSLRNRFLQFFMRIKHRWRYAK